MKPVIATLLFVLVVWAGAAYIGQRLTDCKSLRLTTETIFVCPR